VAALNRQGTRDIMSKDQQNHAANAVTYRAKAADCASTVAATRSPKHGSDARKSERAYTALAANEEWLAKNSDKLV
jgi:hypothetical protein